MEVHMVNRLMALLGLAVVLAAITAGLLAGAASASADTESGSDGDATKTSEPKQESSTEKPAAEGSDTTESDKPAGEASEQSPETSSSTDQPKNRKTSHPAAKTNTLQTNKPGRPSTTVGTEDSDTAKAASKAD
jgi:hypothetical protein